MKSQTKIYFTVEITDKGMDSQQINLVDSSGAKFYVPELNDASNGTLMDRTLSVYENPSEYCMKGYVVGGVKNGTVNFSRTSADHLDGAEPVSNFSKPDGGMEKYRVGSDSSQPTSSSNDPAPSAQAEPVVVAAQSAPQMTNEEIMNLIHDQASDLKPENLFMTELKWKYLIRNIIRGKNIMMTGPAGSGKTMAAKAAAMALPNREMHIFNLGSTQDPRSALIGNTHFDADKGTVFAKSPFVQAITTPNSVVLLDELSRAHPEAHNILMTVLDQGQRYLRLDEAADSPVVKVADGVSFIASANIGNEYTATRQIDRAMIDRFTIIEMDTLDKDQEFALLKMMYPNVEEDQLKSVAEITSSTRDQVKQDAPPISNSLSTRAAVEIGSLLDDGFSLGEAAEITIFPLFDETGGANSERTYIKQLVQKYLDTSDDPELFNTADSDKNPFATD